MPVSPTTVETGVRRSRLAPEARRRQIIQEASRLISRSGFNAVTLADIAEACGIRPPSVLHHFATTNDILMAVVLERDSEADIRRALPPSLSEKDEVRQYLRGVVEANMKDPELTRLFYVLGAEALDPRHPAHEFFSQRTALALDALVGMLQWKPDPRTAALQLLAFWQGLEAIWVYEPAIDFLQVWEAFCDRFFEN
jgi:AcrR family transcriptional regulator